MFREISHKTVAINSMREVDRPTARARIPVLMVTLGCPAPVSLTETARLLHNVRNVFGRRSNTRVNTEMELSRKCHRTSPAHASPRCRALGAPVYTAASSARRSGDHLLKSIAGWIHNALVPVTSIAVLFNGSYIIRILLWVMCVAADTRSSLYVHKTICMTTKITRPVGDRLSLLEMPLLWWPSNIAILNTIKMMRTDPIALWPENMQRLQVSQ